jgi:hypothetical protein
MNKKTLSFSILAVGLALGLSMKPTARLASLGCQEPNRLLSEQS